FSSTPSPRCWSPATRWSSSGPKRPRMRPGKRAARPEKNGLTSVTQPANALDQGRPLEAGFKYDRALDVAQSRAIKRRDNALRQIERWRKGLGAKARRLPDHLLVEHLLAQRYGVEQFLAVLKLTQVPATLWKL